MSEPLVVPLVLVRSRDQDATVLVTMGGLVVVELEGMGHGQAVAVADAMRLMVREFLQINDLHEGWLREPER